MSSYLISERINTQTVLWSIGSALYQLGCYCFRLPTMALQASLWLYTLLMTLSPDLDCLLRASGIVALWVLCLVAIVGLVVLMFSQPLFLIGLVIIAVFGFITYPRKKMCK